MTGWLAKLGAGVLILGGCAELRETRETVRFAKIERAEMTICGGTMTLTEKEVFYGGMEAQWADYCAAVDGRSGMPLPAARAR